MLDPDTLPMAIYDDPGISREIEIHATHDDVGPCQRCNSEDRPVESRTFIVDQPCNKSCMVTMPIGRTGVNCRDCGGSLTQVVLDFV